ncbi:hypothetical protein FQA47_005170 [Oryzias melastigma]|uniref:Uncharacterized protein n=1 Tax=Oryzias melastigma TaxID=30732 RepID=A0A834EZS1_ORYME|nr:hypothetical protein FQA47_005170 [Oryzias melastigma]
MWTGAADEAGQDCGTVFRLPLLIHDAPPYPGGTDTWTRVCMSSEANQRTDRGRRRGIASEPKYTEPETESRFWRTGIQPKRVRFHWGGSTGAESGGVQPGRRVKSPAEAFQVLRANSTSQRASRVVFQPLAARFVPSAWISVASSSGHQTAQMGAVTLHSAPGNPTLRKRHNARRRVGDHFRRSGNAAIFGGTAASRRKPASDPPTPSQRLYLNFIYDVTIRYHYLGNE